MKSKIVDKKQFEPMEKGSLQGGIILQLLTNIYLNKFDQYMKSRGIRIVRYADDILVFATNKSEAGRYRAIATKYFESELKLTVIREKTHLTNEIVEKLEGLAQATPSDGV